MKKFLLSLVCFSPFIIQNTFAQVSLPNRGCGTMELLEAHKKADPELEARMQKIEEEMQAWITNNAKNPKPMAVIKIPTVVHVIYKTSAENLSDALIQGGIDALNKDFRKMNSDWTKINTANPNWASLVADCEVEFCLATKDPSGNPTNGITRTQTTYSEFGQEDNKIKFTSGGGHDAWPASQYLNLWSVNFGSSGLLGYAQFPGQTASTDGVVCEYKSLPGPPTFNPYDLGRTITHEVGHWLNLRHTFQGGCAGLNNNNCSTAGDLVCDTPPISSNTYGCPTNMNANTCTETSPFPAPYTSNQPNMWMNYMDYTDDACMYMFTLGQKTRIQACLNTSRSGLGPASATKCSVTGINDLLSSDNISLYPNPSTGDIFISVNIPTISSADVIIYNAIGEAVLQKKITIPASNEVKLDMNSKPDGMYLIKLKTAEGTITKKIVINR